MTYPKQIHQMLDADDDQPRKEPRKDNRRARGQGIKRIEARSAELIEVALTTVNAKRGHRRPRVSELRRFTPAIGQ